MAQLFQDNKFTVIVKPLEGTNKSSPQQKCRVCLLSLGGLPGRQCFKFNDYHHTASIFNANMLAAGLSSNQN